MEMINGHEIGTTDKGNGKWSATCGTCAVKLTPRAVGEGTLKARIAEHTQGVSGEVPPSEPESPAEGSSVLDGTRKATAEDREATKPRRGPRAKRTGVTVTKVEPQAIPAKVITMTGRDKLRVPESGMDNFRYMAAHADTESARAYWSRLLTRAEAVA